MKTSNFVYFCIVGYFLLGCSITAKTTNSYSEEIAQGTGENITVITENILNRFSYTVNRSVRTDNRIMFESDWKNRIPFDSEKHLGYEEVRNKIIITARPYMRSEMTEKRVYNVKLEGLTEYRLNEGPDWIIADINDEATNYLKEIAYELKTELERVLYR